MKTSILSDRLKIRHHFKNVLLFKVVVIFSGCIDIILIGDAEMLVSDVLQ